MCATCGCGTDHHDHHDHAHSHADHDHHHAHGESHHDHAPRTVRLEQDILAKNDEQAERNRRWLRERNILAINFASAPGSGKTTLLEKLIRQLSASRTVSVIEGDQETERDAERLRGTGRPVVQINTGAGCHLDAAMVERGLGALEPEAGSIVLVENVGNLVCPALFDLGERAMVVLTSVTEGEDKPLKYPHMFRVADAVVLNKIDLLPHVDFDVSAWLGHLRRVNRGARVFEVSALRQEGLVPLCDWLVGLSR